METGLTPVDALRSIRAVLADRDLTPASRIAVVGVVLRADNKTGMAWTSYTSLKREFGLSMDPIAAALRSGGDEFEPGLAIGRYLELVRRGRHSGTQFRVLRPAEYSAGRSTPENGGPVHRRTEDQYSAQQRQTSPVSSPKSDPKKEQACPKDEIMEYWNSRAERPRVRKLSGGRERRLLARWGDQDFRRDWRGAIDRLEASRFCNGQNGRGWVADFDWFVANDTNWLKALEGKYDNRNREFQRGKNDGSPRVTSTGADPDARYRHLL